LQKGCAQDFCKAKERMVESTPGKERASDTKERATDARSV
jgi:hypothetical protein